MGGSRDLREWHATLADRIADGRASNSPLCAGPRWEQAGRPNGRSDEFWFSAQVTPKPRSVSRRAPSTTLRVVPLPIPLTLRWGGYGRRRRAILPCAAQRSGGGAGQGDRPKGGEGAPPASSAVTAKAEFERKVRTGEGHLSAPVRRRAEPRRHEIAADWVKREPASRLWAQQ